MTRAVATGALLAFAVSCSRTERPWVDRIQVDAFEGGEVVSLSEQQLRKMLEDRLIAARFRLVSPQEQPPRDAVKWRVDFAARLTEPDLESLHSSVGLAIDVRQVGQGESIALTSRVKVQRPPKGGVEEIQKAIKRSLEDGLSRLTREAYEVIALSNASAEQLANKLKASDAVMREAAMHLLVRKRDPRVLPVLLSRLKSTELSDLRSAITHLVELQAPSAVNPLIEAATHRGPEFQREVVFAVGAIGGSDAEAYLDFVSNGHDDPLVRASAEHALKELRDRDRLRRSQSP